MSEASRPWQSTTPGDAGPYSAANWQQLYQYIIGVGASRPNVGLFLGSGTPPNDALRVQAQGTPSTSIDVLSGSALVQGVAYINTSTVSLTIAANASGNPRIDTIILRADYALQTVRLAVKQGTPAASPSAPALTQSANIMWEIPLADIAVANGFVSITNANISPRYEWANAAVGVYLDNVLNNSGGTLVTGDVVIWDSSANRAVTTTTTANDTRVAGTWVGTTANGAYGRVLRTGIGYVNADAAVTRGQFLSASTTVKKATPGAVGYGGAQLAMALETTSGAGLCLSFIAVSMRAGQDYVLVQDQKASGSAPASITSGAWRTRVLNTEVIDTGNFATVASNQVTLKPGRYAVSGAAPATVIAANNRIRVQNITAGTTVAMGPNVLSSATVAPTCVVEGEFVITVDSVFELQHWSSATAVGGIAVSSGDNEVYASIAFTRLGEN